MNMDDVNKKGVCLSTVITVHVWRIYMIYDVYIYRCV